MESSRPEPPDEWCRAWADVQQSLRKCWPTLPMAQFGKAQAPVSGSHPWNHAFETWAKSATAAAPEELAPWVTQWVEATTSFMAFGEILVKALSIETDGGEPHAWVDFFCRQLQSSQEAFAAQLGKDAAQNPWTDTFAAMSAIPSLGFTREWQERMRLWQERSLGHQEAAQVFGKLLFELVGQRAVDLLRTAMEEPTDKGKTPETLKSLYDLWVDCGERAYAEAALRPDFTLAQAGLVNAVMALKQQEQILLDQWLGAMNLPTRRELGTSHQRLHELRRQVSDLRQALEDAGIDELRAEVAALRQNPRATDADAEA